MNDTIIFSVFADLHWREGDWTWCVSAPLTKPSATPVAIAASSAHQRTDV